MSNLDQDVYQIKNDLREVKNQLNDIARKIERIDEQTRKSSELNMGDILKGAFFADMSHTLSRIEAALNK
ncbi:MAG: hypothetical protein PHV30_06965 [Candidatus Margulisbacteria bacterium]|nr:hypothetical protein [Candidatus Margulisiibacteriota bacterium]